MRLAGLDAAIFMRFNEMCRNMFLVMAVVACAVLVPVNYLLSIESEGVSWSLRLTPQNAWNNAQWGTVVCAWLYNIMVLGSLSWNYRKVLHLRRDYFESPEYQASLHARTLMVSSECPSQQSRVVSRTLTGSRSFTIYPKNYPPTRVLLG